MSGERTQRTGAAGLRQKLTRPCIALARQSSIVRVKFAKGIWPPMSPVRNNHFVPQWYQQQFLTDGRNTLCYLDLYPEIFTRRDGSKTTGRALFDAPTSRAFVERDLYSTFFGATINDEIERKLFGNIDTRGAHAVRAFCETDKTAWHAHFESLFEYIDAQKLRTPKGLRWLKRQYPELPQNELMIEMQSIRFLNCTIWTTGVREIVSAEESSVKFIITDHPVTVYNHGSPPRTPRHEHTDDPAIELKGSQTIFPLGPDHCLILTNLEYAENSKSNPLETRTFARRFHPAMVSTAEFIRSRKLGEHQVSEINLILKTRAQRHIAAGREAWLYPEQSVCKPWKELRHTLLPPKNELYRFGGEMYVRYESGHVHYQDQFGRSGAPNPHLQKKLPASPLKPKEACGCGSGAPYSRCCRPRVPQLRPSWTERSIRERNLMLFRGLSDILELEIKDWTEVRRGITDEKIVKSYTLYENLWPRETDLLSLLPKPDGVLRSVYTGPLHPQSIHEFATGSSLYFGEVLIQHPFVNPVSLKKGIRPTDQPHQYRGEFLKSIMLLYDIIPLVDAGIINLIPDPCDFDLHLRDQMYALADARNAGLEHESLHDPRIKELLDEDLTRMLLALPDDTIRNGIIQAISSGEAVDVAALMSDIERLREDDPLAILQSGSLHAGKGGQFQLIKMAPNFEIAMFLAQATGSQILTDSRHRWFEIKAALNRKHLNAPPTLQAFSANVHSNPLMFPWRWQDILRFSETKEFTEFRSTVRQTFNYVNNPKRNDTRPNFEAQLAARYLRSKSATQRMLQKAAVPHSLGQPHVVARIGGIQDNTVNRLLLMSNSRCHLPWVPMAMFVARPEPARAKMA